ncbi:MAG: FHA domain-containing protein [Planctomycetaceae bacterium]
MAASLVPTEGGNPIPIDKPIVLIGRHQECDVSLLKSTKVSRRHCCIVQAGERFVLRDLGSMNGIRVNGHRVVETELSPGDEITVADVAFQFQCDDSGERSRKARPVAQARPKPPEASNAFPVPLPDEMPEADDEPGEYRADGDDLQLKHDSHSESGFARV